MDTHNINNGIYNILKNVGVKEIKKVVLKTSDNKLEFIDQSDRVISMSVSIDSDVITEEELYRRQAPSFNFELNTSQLLDRALKSGYVTKVKGVIDRYEINQDYKSEVG